MTHLLDANVLIALTVREHVHHTRASRWFSGAGSAALCPVTEGALVRYAVRVGVPAASVQRLLGALRDEPRIEFWPDDLGYADIDLSHVVGHRQVTDAYLAALAHARSGILATMDAGLHTVLPDTTLLIPE